MSLALGRSLSKQKEKVQYKKKVQMALGTSPFLKHQTMLQQLLEEINFQRTKEMRQLLKDGIYYCFRKMFYYAFITDILIKNYLLFSVVITHASYML